MLHVVIVSTCHIDQLLPLLTVNNITVPHTPAHLLVFFRAQDKWMVLMVATINIHKTVACLSGSCNDFILLEQLY